MGLELGLFRFQVFGLRGLLDCLLHDVGASHLEQ